MLDFLKHWFIVAITIGATLVSGFVLILALKWAFLLMGKLPFFILLVVIGSGVAAYWDNVVGDNPDEDDKNG